MFLKNSSELNYEFSNPKEFVYSYMDVNPEFKNSFSSLRIIESADKSFLDVKVRNIRKIQQRHYKVRIFDPDLTKEIFAELGHSVIMTFHKKRQTFCLGAIRLDLDDITELGLFLEVKFKPDDKQKVEDIISSLGLKFTDMDSRSMMEIYLSKS